MLQEQTSPISGPGIHIRGRLGGGLDVCLGVSSSFSGQSWLFSRCALDITQQRHTFAWCWQQHI